MYLVSFVSESKDTKQLNKIEISIKDKGTAPAGVSLNAANRDAYQKYQALLKLKGYSERTLQTYTHAFHYLLRLLGEASISSLTKQHIQSYLLWLLEKRCKSCRKPTYSHKRH